jgi:hypothetical protein
VLAILGILFGLGAVGSRTILRGQQNRSSLYSVRQIFWQGASAAASRGVPLTLTYTSGGLEVKEGSKVIRTVELSKDTTLSLPKGQIATFSPSGKATITAGTNPFTLTTEGKTYSFTVSLIGEVKMEAQ